MHSSESSIYVLPFSGPAKITRTPKPESKPSQLPVGAFVRGEILRTVVRNERMQVAYEQDGKRFEAESGVVQSIQSMEHDTYLVETSQSQYTIQRTATETADAIRSTMQASDTLVS